MKKELNRSNDIKSYKHFNIPEDTEIAILNCGVTRHQTQNKRHMNVEVRNVASYKFSFARKG